MLEPPAGSPEDTNATREQAIFNQGTHLQAALTAAAEEGQGDLAMQAARDGLAGAAVLTFAGRNSTRP